MSFTSRLEGLLHQVGLRGVVDEVRAKLGLARETAAPRNEAAPPPYVPQPTVVERTPRPAPVAAPVEAEPPAPKAPARRGRAKPARASKAAKAPAAEATAPKPRKRPSRAKAKKRASGESAAPQDASLIVGRLVEALRAHPQQEELVSAGKQKDQLVRSLIPLYLARAAAPDVEVTSGTTSRFWGELGVTYAAPNAAKALRLHSGYAQDTKKGKAITPRGIEYVEQALARLRAPQAR